MKTVFRWMILIILIVSSTSAAIAAESGNPAKVGTYGGISNSATNPPENTEINADLSAYYGVPVATGDNGLAYWYYVGKWYSREEVLNLPSETIMYGVSPDETSSRGSSHGSDSASYELNKVAMPVTNIALLGFVAVAFLISTKIERHYD